ncbi:MAG: MerR family transcriptional regulator [Chitinophagales bacterium]|nr:MerR family transcriptional regulator [Chitinophagales bacterium]HAE13371.1 helix-turn-helix-type transcriptional regulator [Bacteroidota bacterium]MCB9020693.1 MerR family transcriptional regulator [Chitinophagales bacterium]HPE96726.1 MerR family transcriptional regulator [Chitinophagales bacterium]HPR28719.1 MerR family transcriptional regulator [Chitinophagales bacterium]
MSSVYSIKDLERLSGVKAHTIRMWEQRYGLLKALRTPTNIRYYNDHDLKYLMSIALLTRKGYRISVLADKTEEEIAWMVGELTAMHTEYDAQIEGLIIATIDYDEDRLEKILNTCILQLGFEETFRCIVFPFLEKVGLMWVSGAILAAQEHFMSQLLRQKILVAIDGHVVRHTDKSKHFLLFLPNGEWHELTLLFLQYLLKARNHRVTYLGASVPLQEVLTVAETLRPDFFYTIITSVPSGYSPDEYLNTIAGKFPDATVYASGTQFINTHHSLSDNVRILNGLDNVLAGVEELAA